MRLILLFFYLFPISFNFIPLGLTTRIFISIFGILILGFRLIIYQKLNSNRKLLSLVFLMAIFGIVSILSLLLNNTTDLQFVLYPISLLLILSAAYFIIYIYNFNFKRLFVSIILAIILQNILSLCMFILPNFAQSLNAIQKLSELDELKVGELSGIRLLGFGSSYFGSGIINCFGLILIAYLYSNSDKLTHRVWYVLLFLITGFIGILKARTTFIGILLSLLLITILDWRKTLKFLTVNILLVFTLGSVLLTLVLNFYPDSDILLQFGFEMFDNFFRYGSLESDSTNELTEMYQFPTELKTWIIGDGHWNSIIPGDFTYYKNTDVGYLRMIYYFGLIGTLFYFWFHFNVFNKMSFGFLKGDYRKLIFILSLLLVILNFKGFADIFYLVVFFIFQKPVNDKQTIEGYSHS